MNLKGIIKGLAIADRRGRFESEVSGIVADSRNVRPGCVFVAVRGLSHDGHGFIRDAIERGATAVIAEEWDSSLDDIADGVDIAIVPSTRKILGNAAANFYGQPSRKLHVAGVTGTNGKTTVSYVLESIILAAGRKVGVVGTVDVRYAGQSFSHLHTTPGAIELQRTLADMVEEGVSHAVLEVSSHALDQQRTGGIHFKVAGFTNLSQDHLDYHKTMTTYFEAKARLFSDGLRRSRARGRMAVVNLDDPRGAHIVERWGGKTLGVSLDPESNADVVVLSASYGIDGTSARIRTSKGEWDIQTSLLGAHNLSNVCVAVGMALAMGFSKARILRGLEALERVPGRMERVHDTSGRTVFVDYAHSPDALSNVLQALKPHAKGRLVVVFGAGGDRDPDKRSEMGEVVGRQADAVFLSNDNPRREDPEKIVQQVAEGLEQAGLLNAEDELASGRGFLTELDRQRAIYRAVELLGEDDVLLIAGKGHEAVQEVGERRYRFDDREVARRALEGLPPAEMELIEAPGPERQDEPHSGKPVLRGVTQTVRVEDVIDETFEVEDGSIEAAETADAAVTADQPAGADGPSPEDGGPEKDEEK